jgi:hypothetical protein
VVTAQWTERLYPPAGGQDHLGLASVSSDRILPKLSPGIIVQTVHPRYVSFYTFLLDEFWRRDLPRTRAAFSRFFRPREAIFAVGAHLCDRPEHSQGGPRNEGVLSTKEGQSGRGERSSPGHLHVGRRTVGSDDVGDAVAPAAGSHLRPGTSRPRREGADSEAPGGNACRGCDNRCSQRSDRRLRPKCEPIPAMSRGIADAPPASSESACIGEELRDTGSTVRDA